MSLVLCLHSVTQHLVSWSQFTILIRILDDTSQRNIHGGVERKYKLYTEGNYRQLKIVLNVWDKC